SPGAGAASASSSAAASTTVRASGPLVGRPNPPKPNGPVATTPRLGLKPTTPQIEAGMRIEPPPSLPWAAATSPAATAAAAPPLEPPAVHPGRHGLRVGGPSAVSQYREQPNSLVAVLPRLMVPAARKAATTSSSYSGTKSVNASEPYVVRTPRVACRSLIATGTPSSGGGYSSLASRSSAARACAVAASGVTVTKAPSRLLCASIRAR